MSDKKFYDADGLLHKEDGPALMLLNGISGWYIHGKKHRLDGPAIQYPE